ncbi:peptidoglycan D,D-transpeptidase FtsI family protein [Kribbia dieselivorans]|uniref:peptidoglycan D,D-transpeptidase FtsI family protein n=1 Tax=Kribbia dieselivorans TaxID=331526 RepID=UPI000838C162|nr:penicillin-binding transpeptidase domain-containing protein [Kribbia dieselivorans]
MNTPIRRLSWLAAMLFALLLIASTWIQSFGAPGLNERPGNRRTLLASYNVERGQILLDGNPIARSVPNNSEVKYQRVYSQPQLYSHLTGYQSFIYGTGGGIESAMDATLSGRDDNLFYRRFTDQIMGRTPTGASVELTINAAVQKAADEALGNQRGAVVALDPTSGAILAMVSHPNYNPSQLASQADGVSTKAWKDLNADSTQPLQNRAISRLYPPGSAYKVVTAAAALDSGKWTKDSTLPGPAQLKLPLSTSTMANSNRQACGPDDKVTFLVALQNSCNTAFGWLGMQLGADTMRSTSEKFGFNQQLDVPMTSAASVFPAEIDQPGLALGGIGQGNVQSTPLQMAMVAAAVANKGEVMKPFMVEAVRAADLSELSRTKPEVLSRAMKESTATQLNEMMQAVVTNGTGTRAAIPGVQVAGKTGTAEHGKGQAPHAWFIGFAPANDPKVAVAVVVEDGGRAGTDAYGGAVAGPISKAVMEAALR